MRSPGFAPAFRWRSDASRLTIRSSRARIVDAIGSLSPGGGAQDAAPRQDRRAGAENVATKWRRAWEFASRSRRRGAARPGDLATWRPGDLHARLDAELREALLLEVLSEHVAQLRRGGVVGGRVLPGVAGVQDLARHAGAGARDLQVEDRMEVARDRVELPVQRGVQERASVADRPALADAVGAP